MAGMQCHKLLWWKVNEPDAVELQPGIVLEDRFDQGTEVGKLATESFADGVTITVNRESLKQAVTDTKAALDTGDALESGAEYVYEASFLEDETFVAVDVLERLDKGFRIIEVKSSSSLKGEHISDVAVQKYVLGRAGLDASSTEIMHLNKEYRHPDIGDLFERTDVTFVVDAMLPGIPGEIDRQLEMLEGKCPDVEIGGHCFAPYKCPFLERCWPKDPNHIMKFFGVGKKTVDQYFKRGIRWISDLPSSEKLRKQQAYQLKSMQENRLIIQPGLSEALQPFDCKLGYLDFETIARAIPVWPGMGPWHQAAAQFSYHESNGDGTYSHTQFLAEGSGDARPDLAERMIQATKNAERVLMYTAFEKTQIRALKKAVPDLVQELEELEHKLIDLHPVIRDYVYHPDFEGSFSLKNVLTPLVPSLTYSDLMIVDGLVASVKIARLLFVSGNLSPEQHEKTRVDLLEYCKRDTWATVKLLERLRELALAPPTP